MKKLPHARGLIVTKSRTGFGIFSKKAFKPGTVVFEVTGTSVTGYKDDDLPEGQRNNLFRFNSRHYINPEGQIGDYLNHSCNPNAYVSKVGKKLYIKALVPIALSSEVTIDYSTITASDDSWTMRCRCGSAKCRKIIKKFRTLPEALKDSYIQKGMVPKYINAYESSS